VRRKSPDPGPGRSRTGERSCSASVRALKQHRRQQAVARLALGEVYTDHGLIFATETGNALSDSSLTQCYFRPLVAAVALRLEKKTPPAIPATGISRIERKRRHEARAEMETAALAKTGLDRLRLYDLRHSSATLGLEAGEDLKTVSERLGHSTITLTADTYAHVQSATKTRAAGQREALLFGTL
jgi:integrase